MRIDRKIKKINFLLFCISINWSLNFTYCFRDLSYQVLQEFYITATAKLQPGLDSENARKDVRSLLVWHPVVVNDRVLENAWLIQDRFQISWRDALVVSAAQLSDCLYLLTEDLQEHQEFESLLVTNPFHVDPASLKP